MATKESLMAQGLWDYYNNRPAVSDAQNGELCGAEAHGGPCKLPKGHNMGRLDIPSNHQACPTLFNASGKPVK